MPALDRALYALVTDLDQSGLLDDVVIVMGGEFGRTPRIGDSTADGRGHWPQVMSAMIAGGGLKMGQVIGATDSRAERSKEGKITFQNVLATMYHVMGVDPTTKLSDFNGRWSVVRALHAAGQHGQRAGHCNRAVGPDVHRWATAAVMRNLRWR